MKSGVGWEGFEAWRQIPSFSCQGHMTPAPAHWASSCWGTAEHFHLMDTEAEQINPRHGKMCLNWGLPSSRHFLCFTLALSRILKAVWCSNHYGIQYPPTHPSIRYFLKACLVLGAGLVLVKPSRQRHSNALEQGCQI